MLMQTSVETESLSSKLENVAKVLRIVGWAGFSIQLLLAAVSGVLLLFAISGRNFREAIAPSTGVAPRVGYTVTQTTPGVGISIFWTVCGILALLFSVYLAFRQTRFARRLRNPDPSLHPKKADVLQVLRLGIIVGFVGMLLAILGSGAAMGVLLSKTVAQPQGVAIYNPNLIIRSLDVFCSNGKHNGYCCPLYRHSCFLWAFQLAPSPSVDVLAGDRAHEPDLLKAR